MPYKVEGIIVYPFDTFVYNVEVHMSTKDKDGTFRYELMGSKNLEIDKFLGFSKEEYNVDKKTGISFSRSTELLAAPIEFIKKQNGVWYEYQSKKRKSKKKTDDKSGSGSTIS